MTPTAEPAALGPSVLLDLLQASCAPISRCRSGFVTAHGDKIATITHKPEGMYLLIIVFHVHPI